jgi:hypothetical protein
MYNIKVLNTAAHFLINIDIFLNNRVLLKTVKRQYNIHVQRYDYSVHKTTMLFLVDRESQVKIPR